MEDVRGSAEAVGVDGKRSCRLYPSLPQMDRREAGGPLGATPRGLHGRSTDVQAEAADGDQLKTQILTLEEQKKELLLINEKWAREYRSMKHFYSEKVRELRTIQQRDISHTEEEEEKKTAAGSKVKDEDSVKAGEARCSGEEAAELRLQSGSLTSRWQHRQQEKQGREDSVGTRPVRGTAASDAASAPQILQALQASYASSETLEDVWKHQAEVYREDFLKERSDREALHGRYLELEKKYRRACRELRALNPQARPTKPVSDCRCRNPTRPQNLTSQPQHKPTCALNFMPQ